MFSQLYKLIKGIVDPFVLLMIIFVAVFELIVDRDLFKEAGMIKDAKVTTVISIIFLTGALALFVIIIF